MITNLTDKYLANARRQITHTNVRGETFTPASSITKNYTFQQGRVNLYYASLFADTCNSEGHMNTISISERVRLQIGEMLKNADLKNLCYQMQQGATLKETKFKRAFFNATQQTLSEKVSQAKTSLVRDSNLDEELLQQLQMLSVTDRYREMQVIRSRLPSEGLRNKIIETIEKYQIVVITGQTGSGKTTQVPQFILDDFILKKKGSICNILCTQLRRISAVSVAERVAEERVDDIGGSVGYRIRLDHRRPRARGAIEYCTTGIILKEMEKDPSISEFSHLIMDEVHERDIMTDFMFALIKRILIYRSDLKVILMGATLNTDVITEYFNNCPHIVIPGSNFIVDEYYLEDVLELTKFTAFESPDKNKFRIRDPSFSTVVLPYLMENSQNLSAPILSALRNPMSEQLNLNLVFSLITHISRKKDDYGAILVFLSGYSEISSLYNMLTESAYFSSGRYCICPLHSTMCPEEQSSVFDKSPFGVRKIVIATNIAETSITIEDVVYVIDCGKIKLSNFDLKANSQSLEPHWVSAANAEQRKGRAGRVKPGVCYRLYTRARYRSFKPYQAPEIMRKRLDDIVLNAKVLHVGNLKDFFEYLLDKPDPKALALSVQNLQRLQALDGQENLTHLGYHLAKLPMAPQLGKMILLGAIFSCVDPMLTIAATLDFRDPFQMTIGSNQLIYEKKLELSADLRSDHILVHKVLMEFEDQHPNKREQFCKNYYLSYDTCLFLLGLRRQLMNYLYEMNFVSSSDPHYGSCNYNKDDMSLVRALIAASLYPNVLNLPTRGIPTLWTPNNATAKHQFHPKSIIAAEKKFDSLFAVYFTKVQSRDCFIQEATLIATLPLIFFGHEFTMKTDNLISISNERMFICNEITGNIIKKLRIVLQFFLDNKFSHPSPVSWEDDRDAENYILAIIKKLIRCEDTGDINFNSFDRA